MFNQIYTHNKTPDQLDKIKKFIKNPFGFFVIAGTNGNGKSFTAEVIYNYHTPFRLPYFDHDEAYFILESDMFGKWKSLAGDSEYFCNELKETKLLVIDDLGQKIPTEGYIDFLRSIIDHRWRYRDKIGTLITTNLTSILIKKHYGDHILSRVCSGVCIRFSGEDERVNTPSAKAEGFP